MRHFFIRQHTIDAEDLQDLDPRSFRIVDVNFKFNYIITIRHDGQNKKKVTDKHTDRYVEISDRRTHI